MLPETIGRYRVTGRLGEGGMGEIFAAFDEKLNRTVAVKLISSALLDDDRSRRRFLREARAAAALDHPFICTIHEVLEHDGQPAIVMECVPGETLFERIARGALPVTELCQYAIEIAEALGGAHARGVIHRDIKSGNIMITTAGHVKVMDFGLALITAISPTDQTDRVSEERSQRVAGTLPYIAPELLRGEEAGPASDLYALGVVMYEMATARRPFTGRTDALLFSEILNSEPASARQINHAIPTTLDDLISRLLGKNGARRPTAPDVIAELRAIREPQRGKRQRALAVLPFRALNADAESAHLGVALADATTSELALVRSLLVRPTATILRYENHDPAEAGRDLGVDAVVTGTFQRAGSRLRVSVQLIDVAEERPLWSTKIDTTIDDIFAMQDEVSRKIVDALELELTPADERRFATRLQASGDLLELCLKGRVALLNETVPAVNEAIEYFERAHAIDPNNPLPLVGLSDAYGRLAFTWDPNGGWHERAAEMCERVLQLDPDLPEARYLRGRLAWTPQRGFEHEYAMTEIAAAIAERPNLNEAYDWLATILMHVGLIDEGREMFERAMVINPADGLAERHLGTLENLTGNYRAAVERESHAALRLDNSWTFHGLATAQIHLGDIAAAQKTIDGAARKFPTIILFQTLRALMAALHGDETAARREIARTLENRKQYGHFHHAEFDVACALAILHHNDEALTWLESATRNGFPCLAAVENERFFDSLHEEPRYLDLVARLRETRDHFSGVWAGMRGSLSSG